MTKRFAPGEVVEIRRNTSFGPWEPAEYVRQPPDWMGWHEVRLPEGRERRISSMSGEEVSDDDPSSYLTRRLSVPSRRIRKVSAPKKAAVQP